MVKRLLEILNHHKGRGIPFVDKLAGLEETILLAIMVGAVALILVFAIIILCGGVRRLKVAATRRAIIKFFGNVDLSQFRVQKMGKVGSRYYMQEGFNIYKLSLPHWKRGDEDGTKDRTKRFNKVVWEESVLWLHAGRKVYVLCTKDPWDMLFLVHALRETGLDIAPCQHELDKQERLEHEKRSCDDVLGDIVERMDGNRMAFIELCRQRLCIRGYLVGDAPKNPYGIDLFIQKEGKPNIVKCLLTPRDHLTGLEDMKSFKEATEEFFAEACTLITTGHITVAAAGFARERRVDIICNEGLVELLEENKLLPPEQAYLRWQLTDDDLQLILPNDLYSELLKK